MSGGSFDYVSVTDDIGDVARKLYELKRLRDALAEYEGSELAVADTDLFINTLKGLERELSSGRFSAVQKVWHAVEWHQSGDWCRDDVIKALAEHRRHLPTQVAMEVPMRHAKLAVERLPGGETAWPGLVALVAGAVAAALEESERSGQ